MITEEQRSEAAAALMIAARDRVGIPPLTETWSGLEVDDAYAVQRLVVGRRVAAGAERVGWKIGLTSAAMQRQLGVDQPDFGPLLDEMRIPSGGTISTDALIAPRVEGEIAFVLDRDVTGPGVRIEEVAESVKLVVPALEVIDSRIADWKIQLADTIADHASCALFVTGDSTVPLEDLALPDVELTLLVDGEEVDRGFGNAVLGNPLHAVAWLAETLAPYGEGLSAGEVILAGALHASVPVRPGEHVEARFCENGLGAVAVSFVKGEG